MEGQSQSLRSLYVSAGSINTASAALGTMVALQVAATGGTQQTVSLAAASYSLGFLIGCFFVARPLRGVGHIRAFAAAAAVCTICTLVLNLTSNSFSIVLVRLVTGIATAGLYAIGDAWINDTAGPEVRGRTLSIYAIVFGVSAVASQVLVAMISDNLAEGFIVVSVLFCVAIVVLAMTTTSPPDSGSPATVRLKATFTASPTAFVGTFINGAIVTVLLNVMPYNAVQVGIGPAMISLMIATIYLGRIVFQYPLGLVSDQMDRRRVILCVSLTTAGILALIALTAHGDGAALYGQRGELMRVFVFSILLLLGASFLPLYSLLVAHACDRTVPVYVASSAVTLLFVYTLGGIVGPLLATSISSTFGPQVTAWSISAVMILFSGFTAFRMHKIAAVSSAEQAVHIPLGSTSVEMMPRQKRPSKE